MELNYHHLRYFQIVAHEGHLTRAAERLNVSQSAFDAVNAPVVQVAKAGYEPFSIELEGARGVVQTLQAPLNPEPQVEDGGAIDAGREQRVAVTAPTR